MAETTKGLQWYFQQFINNGYNIVAPNYALAPDYKYPTPAGAVVTSLSVSERSCLGV